MLVEQLPGGRRYHEDPYRNEDKDLRAKGFAVFYYQSIRVVLSADELINGLSSITDDAIEKASAVIGHKGFQLLMDILREDTKDSVISHRYRIPLEVVRQMRRELFEDLREGTGELGRLFSRYYSRNMPWDALDWSLSDEKLAQATGLEVADIVEQRRLRQRAGKSYRKTDGQRAKEIPWSALNWLRSDESLSDRIGLSKTYVKEMRRKYEEHLVDTHNRPNYAKIDWELSTKENAQRIGCTHQNVNNLMETWATHNSPWKHHSKVKWKPSSLVVFRRALRRLLNHPELRSRSIRMTGPHLTRDVCYVWWFDDPIEPVFPEWAAVICGSDPHSGHINASYYREDDEVEEASSDEIDWGWTLEETKEEPDPYGDALDTDPEVLEEEQ